MGRVKDALLMEDLFDGAIPWTEEEEIMWHEYEESMRQDRSDYLDELFTDDIEDDTEE